ncbi:hypothetical protein VTK26DRAFT_2756 [Humicola hyalothermophila]
MLIPKLEEVVQMECRATGNRALAQSASMLGVGVHCVPAHAVLPMANHCTKTSSVAPRLRSTQPSIPSTSISTSGLRRRRPRVDG